MKYQEALQYLDSFINYEKINLYPYKESIKLQRIERLLDLLNNPHKDIKAILIGGTKGKGSICCMIASILKEAGFKTGLYTSPHLVSFRERIRILTPSSKLKAPASKNESELGILITEKEICDLVSEIQLHADKLRKDSKLGQLSFFEIYTALAFLYFKMKKVDFVVLEVGLGGRLDATNVVSPLVCGITQISFEHTDKLGNTLKEITREKTGIIKGNNQIVVSSPQEKEVLDVIGENCQRQKAQLYEVGKNIFFEEVSFNQKYQVFNVKGIFGEYPYLRIKLLGHHQLINAATAVGIIEALRLRNIFIDQDSIRHGLEKAFWPGRLEVIRREPLIVLDGAQNVASAVALRNAIENFFNFNKLILILGISKDKDIEGICKELIRVSDQIILTKSKNPRASEPEIIMNFVKDKGRDVRLSRNVKEALELAKASSKKKDLILITGSLFVVGEARELICSN